MAHVSPAWSPMVVRAGVFGAALGVFEALCVALIDHALFLSPVEFLRFALIALLVNASIGVVLGSSVQATLAVLQRAQLLAASGLGRGVVLVLTLVAWPPAAAVLWSLSAGRRVRELPGRLWWVAALAVCSAWGLAQLAGRFARCAATGDARARWRWVWGLCASAACALVVDTTVLRRLYPVFHLSLSVWAWLAVAAASALSSWPPASLRHAYKLALLVVACALVAPFALRELGAAPNARFAVELAAPLTGKLLRRVSAPAAAPARTALATRASPAAQATATGPTVDLHGQDILLITIDALRADRLEAYGGHGVTPELDKLARQSVVFRHAYTSTPHTSYALGSLLTGKYLRPVLSLPNAASQHATLPRLLRRYGYRTAGFYPPAIFFVDQERFKSLHDDRFGFEYVREMFAPADARVAQLARYLDQAPADHPVFAWVHLFEPHEPYEPPAAFRRGNELVELYDGEVAAADAAVGKLVALFQKRRPNSTIIITADHGEEFGDHGGYHHGTTLFEEQTRVPLLWLSPGKVRPARLDAPVEHVDIATTLLRALGMPRDARMRGDDLTPLLAGAAADPHARAFASIDELQMWTDGRFKLLCDQRPRGCRLFDLQVDPLEQRDVGSTQPAELTTLHDELSDFMASLPQIEAAAMEGGGGWPKALARARLGDPSVGPELIGLLGSERAQVRAEALRAIARQGTVVDRGLLATMRSGDPDAAVRAEAALTALTLGDHAALAQVLAVVQHSVADGTQDNDLARRAALLCDPATEPAVLRVLAALAQDDRADEALRTAALTRLGDSHAAQAVGPLIAVLPNVRLRSVVVRALASVGGRAAADALASTFEQERYAQARTDEAQALFRLHDPRAGKLLLRFLGTETGVPDGLSVLLEHGQALPRAQGVMLDLRGGTSGVAGDGGVAFERPSGLVGAWACVRGRGCAPTGDTAALAIPRNLAVGEPARVVLQLDAARSGQWLEVAGRRQALAAGESSASLLIPVPPAATTLPLRASPGTHLRALALLHRSADIPPPKPQAYDAGTDAAP